MTLVGDFESAASASSAIPALRGSALRLFSVSILSPNNNCETESQSVALFEVLPNSISFARRNPATFSGLTAHDQVRKGAPVRNSITIVSASDLARQLNRSSSEVTPYLPIANVLYPSLRRIFCNGPGCGRHSAVPAGESGGDRTVCENPETCPVALLASQHR